MRNFLQRCAVFALFFGTAVAWSGCGRSDQTQTGARHYEARGIVRGFAPDRSTVQIEHENIPDFMPSMTMPFEVRDEKEIAELKIGDAISFRLNVTDRDSWIDRIKPVDSATVHLPVPSPSASSVKSARVHEGDRMPEFQLIDEEGKPISLESFRGHPLVLTFIFTRCPIPNFCPRMSQNFAELQKAIEASPSEPLSATRLLSISFDPANDTPEVLRNYAQGEKAEPGIWKFATGTPTEISRLTKAFSVLVQPEGGSISHGLATALIDKDGKIEKLWRGNGWTPEEVLTALSTSP